MLNANNQNDEDLNQMASIASLNYFVKTEEKMSEKS